MQFDNTGTFQVLSVPPNGEYDPLERLRRCTLCYGKTNEKEWAETLKCLLGELLNLYLSKVFYCRFYFKFFSLSTPYVRVSTSIMLEVSIECKN